MELYGFKGNTAVKTSLILFLVLLPALAWRSGPAAAMPSEYALEVSFDIKASRVNGLARIRVEKGQEFRARIGRLRILSIRLDGRVISSRDRTGTISFVPDRSGTAEIAYDGIFRPISGKDQEFSSTIGEEGVFLGGVWYPKPEGMSLYHLRARLPRGFEAVSEAERIDKAAEGGSTVFQFAFPHPVDSISLIATDRYQVAKETFDGVEIWAYFFREDADLIPRYMAQTKKYIALYSKLISPFPFKRFSIVENFLPTGYSMPTYTLLGSQVVRLPFIPETSLGHEILHQWFGNLVYIDYGKGNWAEGLTTYLADHLYESRKGLGAEYRKDALVGYMSYVNERNEFPLEDFRGRSDQASQAIGYGKTTLVFQMLRTMLGEENFYEAIRSFVYKMRFRSASWDDIRKAFQERWGEDLQPFFARWVNQKGLVALTVSKPEVRPSGTAYETLFDLSQDGKGTLYVPVSVYHEGGKTSKVVRLSGERERISVAAKGLPYRIVLDEDYELARRLAEDEFPAVIARLMGDEKRLIVAEPSSVQDRYGEIYDAFRAKGDRLAQPNGVTHDDVKTSSLVILGGDNPLARQLFAERGHQRAGFVIEVRENPWNGRKVAAVIDGASRKEVDLAFPKIGHYGRFSVLAFNEGRNSVKKTNETARGITQEVSDSAVAVDMSTLKSLPAIIDRVSNRRIVYVGETHDRFSHHLVELEVVKGLHEKGKKVAIGMEMFQKTFQQVLDDYIAGKIDEKQLLKGTEYFSRWSFDYSLYRPILLYARSQKIPVVALNQKREIVEKVFRTGLESLSDEEKKSVPAEMDLSDKEYRERLKGIFHAHRGIEPDKFDFFYQAQVLWDETMAESVHGFVKNHDGYQVVVLAGIGHIAHGSGIPKRVARRNGYEYTTILNDAEVETGIADFVLFPGDVPGGRAPLLQVQLKESQGKVTVESFPDNSASKKAGIRVGDTIVAIDGVPIRSVEDLKIELLSKTRGEKARVKILRKGVLGTRQTELEVVLA